MSVSRPKPEVTVTAPGDYAFTLTHDGLERHYRIHVLTGYDPNTPTPLLVSMHGGGGNMNFQASEVNYGQISKADASRFIVAFPNGVGALANDALATWNAGHCCGRARDKNIDDVGFIRDMVATLRRQLNIDSHRIFATGMSNGAMMAHRLACELPDVFSAIATVAGTDNTAACTPSKAVSVLQIHARNDDHVLFNGGAGAFAFSKKAVTDFTSVPESFSRWSTRNGCSGTPTRVLDVPVATCDALTACRDGVEVELCVTETGKHSWPGGHKGRADEPPSTAISANDVMWSFFMAHPGQ